MRLTDASDEKCPAKLHFGELARFLREAAGLTREELAAQTGIASSTLRNFEMRRHLPTQATLTRLLSHSCMTQLPALAEAEGVAERPTQEPDGAAIYVVILRKRS